MTLWSTVHILTSQTVSQWACTESLRGKRIGIIIFPKYTEIFKLQSCISVPRVA